MIEFLNHEGRLWAEYFGMAVVQNTLFLALIFILLHYMKKRSARIKYIICMVGIFKLLLPPFIPLVLISYTPLPQVNSDISPIITLGPIPGSPEIISPSPVRLNLLGLFFVLWLGFLIFYLLCSFISTLSLKNKVRSAIHLTDISAFIKDSSSKIQIYKSGKIAMPLTLGLFPRRIYVPAVWDQWTEDCRRMVIEHEMAHIKRHDGLFQAFQILAQGIYFFHPLVLLLSIRLKEYREMACDDASVCSQKDSSLKYSRYLVEIAEKMVQNPVTCESASALIRQRKELFNRLKYQMKEDNMRSISKKNTCVIFTGLLLLLVMLSWYPGRARPEKQDDMNQEEKVQSENDVGSTKAEQAIRIVIGSKTDIRIDGESTTLEKFNRMLSKRLSGDGSRFVTIGVQCDNDVPMGIISEIHDRLRELNLLRISYYSNMSDKLALRLPRAGDEGIMKQIPKQNIARILINRNGEILLNDEAIELSELADILRSHNVTQQNKLIVAIQFYEDTKYEDYMAVLDHVKNSGNNRIFVGDF
jgi:beta-lactamase regulating signal transducer with metallopeptidase domain